MHRYAFFAGPFIFLGLVRGKKAFGRNGGPRQRDWARSLPHADGVVFMADPLLPPSAFLDSPPVVDSFAHAVFPSFL